MESAPNAKDSVEIGTSIIIKLDDLSGGEVIGLLEEHLADMYATSPPESVHALDLDGLKSPEITFFSAWKDSQLLGCVAIKELNTQHAELKSMRTSQFARKSGVASQLLQHVLDTAAIRKYQTISLETGSEDYFKAARNLYEKFGFGYCEPFADYILDPHSQFMSIELC
ncbi:GNAT family N-acetyltransferase [Vibrio sp. 10N.286.55.E10]|uniref:GNAT family N-acetyltransferase n=1 Tax=Vibrio TaxID=662 RepID=UPI000C82982B|nr:MULTISPECIES: GNAT family N-acetyltransferase [Vibrio]PME26471.1 GNAT family N-acetyltransferase [Vibrio sp. 10N.286.55.E12]PME30834.1 GNAT family N-acetyltransferase [Vibrio sp. 10N.286.55.E10]PME69017.1 GNAT family N-acetyltransferase [Vibrio sp. 10N.286.55.C11]PTO95444.1 GNAT family N-acetyltransferase [Vibrio sp. 10N.286.45.A3]PTP12764.1 GNAT family N-acetyltransferase [Vibrio sp. 10N.286.51.C3]